MWVGIPLTLIPIAWGLLMMALIKIWMVAAPQKERPIPEYSLHVMYEPPSKQTQKALYGQNYGGTNKQQQALGTQGKTQAYERRPVDPQSLPYGYLQAQERAATPTQFHDTSYASIGMMDRTGASSAYAEKSRII